ncbi:hypothetical protein FRACA_140059 [Frankia canadensis]|uniref:Uncharacterized protein n=1 Tax=Frankia canadensis TaxID=1836972 RepID=A0A2I2KLB1_9ACTN|nr:hypothetical protein FRACA_140059 [Frankia canadensis]SOU53750.1 hypothetical protein FRACA_140059 [Frankia canadensis]
MLRLRCNAAVGRNIGPTEYGPLTFFEPHRSASADEWNPPWITGPELVCSMTANNDESARLTRPLLLDGGKVLSPAGPLPAAGDSGWRGTSASPPVKATLCTCAGKCVGKICGLIGGCFLGRPLLVAAGYDHGAQK